MALTKATYSMVDGSVFNAKDYGADVSGDVTTQLQAALDAAENGILLLTAGHTYAISDTLYPKQGCTIEGNGAIITNNIATVGNPFQIAESGVTIQNLTINNTVNNPTYTISDPSYNGADIFINSIAAQVINTTLRNITINGSVTYASAICGNGDCENVIMENVTVNGDEFVDCFGFEWNYRGGTAPANIIAPKNLQFINCGAYDNNGLAGSSWNYGWWLSACSRVSLVNCRVEDCKNGFYIGTGDNGQQFGHKISSTLTNCQIYNFDYVGLSTSYANTITPPLDEVLIQLNGCHIRGKLKTVAGCYGVQITAAKGPLEINNCIIENVERGVMMGSADEELVFNVAINDNKFVDIYESAIKGYGVKDCEIVDNKFFDVNQGATASVADSAIYLAYQSDRNTISNNKFGLATAQSRFNIALYSAGSPLKIPTGNIVTNNVFKLATVGGVNIINNTSSEDYLCENIVTSNIALNNDVMVDGAVYFSNDGCNRVAYDDAAPTVGTWKRGDTVWNTLPASGGTPGWKCTTAGTPGTWKAMANLA